MLNYQDGDQSDSSNLPVGINKPYPLTPTDNYFTLTSGMGAASTTHPDNKLKYIGCPGNPGTSKDHAFIFGGVSSKFLPPIHGLFEDWEYYNGPDGVFFYTRTDKTDAFLQTALQKLDDEFSECEADIIDASAGDVELISAASGDPICPDGSTCFRVWVIANPSNVYNGDTDGEELAAACP